MAYHGRGENYNFRRQRIWFLIFTYTYRPLLYVAVIWQLLPRSLSPLHQPLVQVQTQQVEATWVERPIRLVQRVSQVLRSKDTTNITDITVIKIMIAITDLTFVKEVMSLTDVTVIKDIMDIVVNAIRHLRNYGINVIMLSWPLWTSQPSRPS